MTGNPMNQLKIISMPDQAYQFFFLRAAWHEEAKHTGLSINKLRPLMNKEIEKCKRKPRHTNNANKFKTNDKKNKL